MTCYRKPFHHLSPWLIPNLGSYRQQWQRAMDKPAEKLANMTQIISASKANQGISNMSGSPLTSHCLDTSLGIPCKNLGVKLYRMENSQWTCISSSATNTDGRIPGLVTRDGFIPGIYKLFFDTEKYFTSIGKEGFYPYVEVVFTIKDPSQHYHVPLLLSPYGYSTYRGS